MLASITDKTTLYDESAMADLIQLRLEDFRAFRKATIGLSPNGVLLLAGPNNVGKSALLSGIDAVAAHEIPPAVRHIEGHEPRVWARWRLNEDERRQLLGSTSETERLVQAGAATWLEWECTDFFGRMQPVAFSVNWPGKVPERLEVGRIESVGESWRVLLPDRPLAAWDQEQRSGVSGSGGQHIPDVLEYLQGQFFSPAIAVLGKWRQGYFHFKPLRESKGRSWGVNAASPSLNSDGANLATVLLWLLTNEPATFQQVAFLVKQIVPGVGQLMVPVSGSECSIVFEDEKVPSHRHNLKDLGTGVEQLLMTLVLGLTQTATTVVMEEPETGLHPGAQRALLALVQDWSKDRLFIASTHSATMLDWSSPTTSVFSVSRTDTESTVTQVTIDRAAILRELGIRLSDVLSAERILILEGPTDKAIFDAWFPEIIRDPQVAVVDGRGGYNARHADLFVKWLTAADQLGPRRVLYARDRDELSAKFLQKLEGSPNVYVLPRRELENMLLDAEALTTVINEERASSGQGSAAATEIEATLERLAQRLKNTVVLKRVMADLAEPVRLVDNELRQGLTKADADQAMLTASVLARLPNKEDVETEIAESWQRHSKAVEDAWEQDWRTLVPGADLLAALWQQLLGRGYGKATDGLAIAQTMKPPAELVQVMTAFTDSSDTGEESAHG
jgi:predicted ATPase